MVNFKSAAVRFLKYVGLFNVVRKVMIDLGLHIPVPHGHSLLIKSIDNKVTEHGSLAGFICVEIGSTRELLPGQGSTAEIAGKCRDNNIHFITVDMDPENTSAASATLLEVSDSFEAINAQGEVFLKNYHGRVDFLYLDAFDIDHGMHSEARKQRYMEHLGSDINNEDCYKMHLDCAIEAVRLLKLGGVIVFDDAWRQNDGWGGKGYSAMPYLLDHGFEIIEETGNTIWLERISIR